MQPDNSELDTIINSHTPGIDYSSYSKQILPLVKSIVEECQAEARQALLGVMTKRYKAKILIDKWLRLNLVKIGEMKNVKLKDFESELEEII
jgi:hypothetical protein